MDGADFKKIIHKNGIVGLQDHGDKVKFRNIWVRPIDAYG